MSDWQPIETAPKDREVLLYGPSDHDDHRYIVGYGGEGSIWDGPVRITPTHWTELPEPPK